MGNKWVLFCALLFGYGSAYGTYEGTYAFHRHGQVNWSWLQMLLPYNPIIVDVGAYCGEDTCRALNTWPKAKIFALEPNPRAYEEMLKNIANAKISNMKTDCLAISDHNGTDRLYLCGDPNGNSLLPPAEAQLADPIEVPCMTLDAWCIGNNIAKIDILRVEVEGFELQALQASPNILKNVKVIWVQSFFAQERAGTTNYFFLKDFLLKANFVVLAHWYTQGGRGNAVYVTQELFDALFVKCWGLGMGGLPYP